MSQKPVLWSTSTQLVQWPNNNLTYLPHSRVASLVPRLNLLYPLPALGFVFLETRVKYMYKGFVSMETFPETCAVDHRPGD